MQQTIQRRVMAGVAVVGVLGAGAAATAVNSSILDGGSSEASAANELIIPTTTLASLNPTTTAAATPTAPVVEVIRVSAEVPEFDLDSPSSSTSTTTVGAVPDMGTQSVSPSRTQTWTQPTTAGQKQPTGQPINSPTTTAAAAPATTITQFAVGAAGTVSVTGDGSTVTNVHASAGSGWSVTTAQHGDDWARVVFRSADTEVAFDLTLTNGQYVTNVTARALSVGTTTVAGQQYHDDDHDDGYEDDDDHDDHDEDDEDDEDDDDEDDDEDDEDDEDEEDD